MNPNDPNNPNALPPASPFLRTTAKNVPPPAPLPAEASTTLILETLLKRPAQLLESLRQAGSSRFLLVLTFTALLSLAAYGLMIGTFSGGAQLWAAPVKVSLGALASVLICLPSLFIFTCLTGAEVTLRGVAGALSTVIALTALLLIGFAPVAWVFSQSTDSVAFMGALHLVFWLVALGFGLRLLRIFMGLLQMPGGMHLRIWTIIFLLVTLQMSTALRPIVGRADDLLPVEKKFFVTHWIEQLSADTRE